MDLWTSVIILVVIGFTIGVLCGCAVERLKPLSSVGTYIASYQGSLRKFLMRLHNSAYGIDLHDNASIAEVMEAAIYNNFKIVRLSSIDKPRPSILMVVGVLTQYIENCRYYALREEDMDNKDLHIAITPYVMYKTCVDKDDDLGIIIRVTIPKSKETDILVIKPGEIDNALVKIKSELEF
ncbi:hypothetical protein [Proteus mirabilis]|uniref:hypothetical protein n=1 Tax=Proteus mirabilis TaxID=584 RepID=UPI0034D606A9